jgi:hypothetical protein
MNIYAAVLRQLEDLLDSVRLQPGLYWQILGIALLGVGSYLVLRQPRPRIVARLASLKWTRGQFCRGWLITGDTNSVTHCYLWLARS